MPLAAWGGKAWNLEGGCAVEIAVMKSVGNLSALQSLMESSLARVQSVS